MIFIVNKYVLIIIHALTEFFQSRLICNMTLIIQPGILVSLKWRDMDFLITLNNRLALIQIVLSMLDSINKENLIRAYPEPDQISI